MPTERGFNMDLAFIYFGRKGISRKMNFVAIFLALQVLSQARVCVGGDVYDLYTVM